MSERHRLALALTLSIALHGLCMLIRGDGLRGAVPHGRLEVMLARNGANATVSAAVPQATKSASLSPRSANDTEAPPQQSSSRLRKEGLVDASVADYLPAEWLTERPSPVRIIDPSSSAPEMASVVGEARLLLLISSTGGVDRVIVIESSLPQPLIDHAVEVFAKSAFFPGKIDGRAVRSRYLVSITPMPPGEDLFNPKSAKQIRERQMLP